MTAESAAPAGTDKIGDQHQAQAAEFIQAPDGGIDFGEITADQAKVMRRQAGKIRLQQGIQNSDGTGSGLTHIEANHGDQIRSLGYDSIEKFVEDALRSIDEIWMPSKT